MKVIIKRDTVAGGERLKASDKAVEVNDRDARYLISIGKAEAVDKKPQKRDLSTASMRGGNADN